MKLNKTKENSDNNDLEEQLIENESDKNIEQGQNKINLTEEQYVNDFKKTNKLKHAKKKDTTSDSDEEIPTITRRNRKFMKNKESYNKHHKRNHESSYNENSDDISNKYTTATFINSIEQTTCINGDDAKRRDIITKSE